MLDMMNFYKFYQRKTFREKLKRIFYGTSRQIIVINKTFSEYKKIERIVFFRER